MYMPHSSAAHLPSGEVGFGGDTPVHAQPNEETYPLMKNFVRGDSRRPTDIGVPLCFKIEHLWPGVEVLSRCEKTGEVAYKRITKVFEHESQEVFHLLYHDKRIDDCRSLVVTPNDPFWVTGKGWVNAIDLEAGDQFETFEGGVSTEFIELQKPWCSINTVYNIEVEDFHTYFVQCGILVYNKGIPQFTTKQNGDLLMLP